MSAQPNAEQALIDDIGSFTHDPYGCALYSFPWGEGELSEASGPREWQRDTMQIIGEHLSDASTRFQPLLIAIASGHGIGKSADMGMILHWAMSTCEDCKVVVTANTDTQLRTKTWPEISKWFRLSINKHWFDVNRTSIAIDESGHDSSWRADAVPWSEHNTEAFAGLHNKGKRILIVFDEASKIHDKVWEVTEGALTDENTEIIWLAFGNPTQNTGRFRECFRKYRHRWVTRQIDSRTVPGTNKAQIQKWVDDYGEDSDFVRVRVRGEFPSASAKQFIPQALVDQARRRELKPGSQDHAAKILTLDPAWSGDDEYVIGFRQGLFFRILATYRQIEDDVWLAHQLARFEDDLGADAVFVDFGYGTGTVSVGRNWGRNWQLVSFGGASSDPQMLNKRGEMHASGKRWLEQGGVLDDDQQLCDELTWPEYDVRLDGKILIESKKDMKARGLPSPNRADAFHLSFAQPVLPKSGAGAQRQAFAQTEKPWWEQN